VLVAALPPLAPGFEPPPAPVLPVAPKLPLAPGFEPPPAPVLPVAPKLPLAPAEGPFVPPVPRFSLPHASRASHNADATRPNRARSRQTMVRTLYISERCISENRGLGPNGAQIDPGLAGRRRKGLLENPNLLLQVVDPPCHPLVDRVRDRRDDELERHRVHRAQTGALGPDRESSCTSSDSAVFPCAQGGIEPPTRGFSVLEGSPETLEDFHNFGTDCPANVRSIAVAQLEAVAEGRATEAAQLSKRLAETALASPLVRAALAVREDGPLAVARAVQLAELLLRQDAGVGRMPSMAANGLR